MIRPRCPTCDKPAPALTCVVWVERADTSEEIRRNQAAMSGRLTRHIYPEEPLRTIGECRRHSNQHVVSVTYAHSEQIGEDRVRGRVRRFGVWDGRSYWHAQHPFCSNPCAVKFARATYEAGYRHRRDA